MQTDSFKTSVLYEVVPSLTCWKIHRWGKVLEMSSLISSRLDSRSDEPASGRHCLTLGNTTTTLGMWPVHFGLCLYLQFQALRKMLAKSSTFLLPGPNRCYIALQGRIIAQHSQYERPLCSFLSKMLRGEDDDQTKNTAGDKRIWLSTLLCSRYTKGASKKSHLTPFPANIHLLLQ